MRILSLGVPLPGPAIDNHSFITAPTFFDYDALIVDPAALSALIADVNGGVQHLTRAGERVSAVETPGEISLATVLRNRRDETERLLTRGSVVVCCAQPNATHNIKGLPSYNNYHWLPAPAGLPYDEPFLRRGYGSQIAPVEVEHPFSPFIQRHQAKLMYQAYLDDSLPGFAQSGTVFARSIGGAAIGVELRVVASRVILLPPPIRPPVGDQRYRFSDDLQTAIRLALEALTSLQ